MLSERTTERESRNTAVSAKGFTSENCAIFVLERLQKGPHRVEVTLGRLWGDVNVDWPVLLAAC